MTRIYASILPVLVAMLLAVTLGCAGNQRHSEIPAGAIMGSEGDGRLAYNAPEAGTVYVYDTRANRMVYSGRVQRGEMVVVNPEADRISVNDRTVGEQNLDNRSTHQLYFLPEGRVEHRRIRVEETRVEDR